ncbi:PORR domain-containing protein [Heracleum sosnowskyi]|uniref:PORR domain-containing protein n=1 Tax=Heracleum sosnowskyi TaxID=360622 RepID=A0AAD8MTF5_9APIA|nr:PORR domain-containing protein [Heracleum sosnowskyi]
MLKNHPKLKKFLYLYPRPGLGLIHRHPLDSIYIQTHSYVNVYMKWKKDTNFDTIESINKSIELKPLISLKNCIANSPNGCIPISDVSKRALQLDVPFKVARFLRLYPSVFQEFIGPNFNLPWFKLTRKAIELDQQEKAIYRDFRDDIQCRLKKFVLMSGEKRLPLKIIRGMQWYLGLPDEYLDDPEKNLDGCFRIVSMEDGLKGLAVECEEKVLSFVQRNAMRSGGCDGRLMEVVEFPLFPTKGMRLKRKIGDWFDKFQEVPYVSPYEEYWGLDSDSDVAEKRVVGVLHEMLGLFVEHAAERKKLLCLKKYMGLPQKFHKVHKVLINRKLLNVEAFVDLQEEPPGDYKNMEYRKMIVISYCWKLVCVVILLLLQPDGTGQLQSELNKYWLSVLCSGFPCLNSSLEELLIDFTGLTGFIGQMVLQPAWVRYRVCMLNWD